MRKIYLVPNFLTTLNMFCGFYSLVASIKGEFVTAAWAILFAAVFDLLDGRVARLAKATSSFGVEYDSLSDLISFGLAPAMVLYLWVLEPFGRIGWLAAFLFLACAALRLARFNVSAETTPKNFFIGIPSPVSAGVVATFVLFQKEFGLLTFETVKVFGLVFSLGLASLMVSNIPFPSFKDIHWKSQASSGFFLVVLMAMVLIAVKPEVALFGILSSYVLLTLLWNAYRVLFKKSPTRSGYSDHEKKQNS